MAKDLEEFKMIIDLAKNGGMMEARIAMMEDQQKQKDEEIAKLREQLKEKDKQLGRKDKQIAEKDKQIEEKDQRIKELESLVVSSETADNSQANTAGQQPVVVIQEYYLLDRPKTISYVCGLEDNLKIFAGHMLLHTMADNMPKYVYDQVNEMTELEGNQTGRLADAIEKAAEKPTTQNTVYPQAGSTANVGCDMKSPDFKILPMKNNLPSALENNSNMNDHGREGNTEAGDN